MPDRSHRRDGRWWLGAVVALVVAALLFSVHDDPARRVLAAGDASPDTFVAPVDLQVVDRLATERQRQAARAQVPELTAVAPTLEALVLGSLAGSGLPADSLEVVVTAYTAADGVRAEQVPEVVAAATAAAPADRRTEVAVVLERRLVPTALVDADLTEAARAAAAAAVRPVLRSLEAGQVIVAAGEPLTPEVLGTLEAAGLYSPRFAAFGRTVWVVLGALLLGALAALPVGYALERLVGRHRPRQVQALVVLALATIVLQRFAIELSASFVLVLLAPLLVAVLVSETAGVLWAVWVSVVTALMVPAAPLLTLLATLVGALVAVRLVRDVRTRPAVVVAGALGGAAGGATLVAWVLLGGGLSPLATTTAVATILAGGVLAGVLALGLLPLFEVAVGFLTGFRLLELSSPSHPLLQRLLVEAPGSYQHSLIISNLVEQAVQAIGGDALLARVGALYHDVGKMRRPHFFVENQFSGENPHDRVSPHLSYLIITSHVRDGVELLREYRLPRELEPFVLEHHGTTVMAYFYKRALEDSTSISELNFRYPGPRPRSKESAVLLLADAVESASRTLADPTQGSIRALIDRLIEQRLQDDQLSQSPLNLHDLEVIAATFERMLTAILHRRIAYPSAEEIRGLRRDGRDPGRNRPLPAA
ncbi:MAG: HDIG domain-containing protein [Trueperaceae bacterium]|nr:HDIG domain-containing protein [Trueperaceae bacterium]